MRSYFVSAALCAVIGGETADLLTRPLYNLIWNFTHGFGEYFRIKANPTNKDLNANERQ